MCPSFRITGNERDVTRGRANSLRLAISGQLGPNALTSDAMLETMQLCVSCKGCRRECPTGVDMARMKIEVLAASVARRGLSLHDRLVAYLPRYAPYAARMASLMNARDMVPGLAQLSERLAGFSAKRRLPRWRSDVFDARGIPRTPSPSPQGGGESGRGEGTREVALFADTFNTYFEPENLRDAVEVLSGLGYRVVPLAAAEGGRPLCCGRTFLSAGLVEEARAEARRLLAAAQPFLERGVPIVGLEPSCLFTLRDELPAMLPGEEADALAGQALLIEELLAREAVAGRIPEADRRATPARSCCTAIATRRRSVPWARSPRRWGSWRVSRSKRWTRAAAAWQAPSATAPTPTQASLAMGELSLLPAVRRAPAEATIAADGFSCRHQIHDGTGRTPLHVVRILRRAMDEAAATQRSAPNH